jgi:hypothetical protein
MCAGHCANRCLRDRPASGYGGTVVRQHPLIPLTLCEGHFPTLKLTNEPLLRPTISLPQGNELLSASCQHLRTSCLRVRCF